MKKKLLFGALAVSFLLYLFAGFWLLPNYATKKLGPALGELLGTRVATGDIRFNPLTFELTVPDLVVYEKEGRPLLKLGALYVDASPLQSLVHLAPTLQQLRLKRPEIYVAIDKNGTFSFEPLLAHLQREENESAKALKKSEGLPKIRIGQFAIESASVTFDDYSTPEPTHIVATNYNFGLENISTVPGEYGFLAYEIETKESAFVRSFAKVELNPLLVRGHLDIRRINFPHYGTYLEEYTRLRCKEGTGELFVRFELSQTPRGLAAALHEGRLRVQRLRIDDAIGTPLKVGTFTVEGIEARWPERSVTIDEVALQRSNLYLAQDAKGRFSFEKWVKTRAKASPKKAAAPAEADASKPWHLAVARIELNGVHTRFETPFYTLDADHDHRLDALRFDTAGGLDMNLTRLTLNRIALTDKRGGTKPFTMKEAAMEDGQLDLADRQLDIARIRLAGADILARRDRHGELNFQKLFAPAGSDKVVEKTKRESDPSPFIVTLKRFEVAGAKAALEDRSLTHPTKLAARNIRLRVDDFRYPQKKRAPFELSLQMPGGGKTAAKGRFLLKPLQADFRLRTDGAALRPYVPFVQEFVNLDIPKGRLTSRAHVRYDERKKPKATIDYLVGVKGLQLNHALKNETIFSVDAIEVAPAKLQLMPGNMKIEKITLKAPYARVHIAKDRSTNLDGLLVERGEAAPTPKPEETGAAEGKFGFFLTRLTIEKGRSDFSDLSLPLPFKTHIHDLEGEALGIGNEAEDVASIRLKGIVDKYGMAKIKALLLPADPLKKSEITLEFRNFDVTNLSPYTGKYIGYAIEDGRLWMNLKYEIDAGRLVSENKIVLKKLELGEKIESNESIDAPVQLALALLKDSDGVIDLDIPVDGNVTDPNFKIGKVVWQAIGNMITGIVTAPFRFLGSMLGLKGEELQYVDFEPGDATVDPTELEKLDKIVRVFAKRPLLKLELTGAYHEKADTRGLRVLKMREILVEKAKLTKTEEVSRAMTQELLEAVYKERAGTQAFFAFKNGYFKAVKAKGEKPDKRNYLKKLYEALLKTVPVTKGEPVALGNARARHIAEHLEKAGLAASRIGLAPAKAVANLTETGMVPLKLGLSTVKN